MSSLQPVLAKALAKWWDGSDEPWPDDGAYPHPGDVAAILAALAADPSTTEAVAAALHEELSMETGRACPLCRERAPRIVAALFGEVTP